MRDTIEVSADLLELMAWEKGAEITIRPDHAELRVGHHLFVAPLPLAIPAQRAS